MCGRGHSNNAGYLDTHHDDSCAGKTESLSVLAYLKHLKQQSFKKKLLQSDPNSHFGVCMFAAMRGELGFYNYAVRE